MTENGPLAFVVDDERAMLDIATFALETQGFRTEAFVSAEVVWQRLSQVRPDLVLLDVMLPGVSGITLCRRIKAQWDIPVILVTAKGEAADRIAGLEADADDYVAKPYHPRELALRAQRLVRRNDALLSAPTAAGVITLDPTNHGAVIDAKSIALTINEFKLLSALVARPGVVLDFGQLLLLGWGESDRLGSREMIKAAIYRLRHKLDSTVPGSSAVIEAVRGAGYLLRTE
ncbi:response regulator transcription factor [Microbacterium testaceum]|uniref:response regulator transcription factor n=1 Tax=Microbacterium testaceum TaxID=2033 RepID=UPI001245EED0|nr:response regulator transcription factor [Microbacterium testaceum]